MNKLYPALPVKVSATTFAPLVGLKIPAVCKKDSGLVGKFVHNHITTKLKLKLPKKGKADLSDYGIEIKSQDVKSRSDITIGGITLEELFMSRYKQSNFYNKLQCVLFIDRNDNFQEITGYSLNYFDTDEIQSELENFYEQARRELIDYVMNTVRDTYLLTYKKSYQKFGNTSGAYLELNQNKTGFQFRMTQKYFDKLCALSNNNKVMANLFV